MKKYIFTALLGLSAFAAKAFVTEVNIGDQYNPCWLAFDWYDDAHTMLQTASPTDVNLTIDERYDKRADGCMNHIYEAKVTCTSPHRLGAVYQLNDNGIPSEVEVNGVKYPVVAIGPYSFAAGPADKQMRIPESVKIIGEGAFFNSTPQGIDHNQFTTIGDYAFYGNKGNGEIKLTNVEKLGKYAFANTGFNKVTIDGNLKEIGEGAFYNLANPGIVTIYIGDNVEVVGDHAFDACTSMGNWGNVVDGHAALYIGKNVKYIGNYAFHEIRNLSQELIIPESTTFIGDYAFCHCFKFCPITLGKNVKHIGAYAFYKADHMCSNIMQIPASVEYIGPMAFDFTRHAEGSRTNGLTDLYVYATETPELPVDENGMSAFGDFDRDLEGFWDVDGWWVYPFVCLHVPQGCYDLYHDHPYWGKFTCIKDDLIPEPGTPSEGEDPDPMPSNSIQNIVGYMFIPLEPNVDNSVDTYQITDEVFPAYLKDRVGQIDTWELLNDEAIISLNPNDMTVTPKKLGEQLILGYNESDNEVYDGSTFVNERTLVGAIMVFVCPTVTLVYDEIQPDENTVAQSRSNIKTMADNSETGTDYDIATKNLATYQHQAIFNSYPKFGLTSPKYITFTTYEKGHFDENGLYANDYENLTDIEEGQFVGHGSDTESNDYIVPLTSITENRVIKVGATVDPQNDNNTTVGVSDLQTPGFRIYAKGRTVYIEGAEEGSVADIFDLSGKKVLSTTEKTFQLSDAGVYILELGDYAVKIVVR